MLGSVTAYPVPAASCNYLLRELQVKAAGLLPTSKSPPPGLPGRFLLVWPLV